MTGLAEILGVFLLVVGAGAVIGAAALVSTALAVLAAGAFLILAGTVVVYLAAVLDQAAKKPATPAADAPY